MHPMQGTVPGFPGMPGMMYPGMAPGMMQQMPGYGNFLTPLGTVDLSATSRVTLSCAMLAAR